MIRGATILYGRSQTFVTDIVFPNFASSANIDARLAFFKAVFARDFPTDAIVVDSTGSRFKEHKVTSARLVEVGVLANKGQLERMPLLAFTRNEGDRENLVTIVMAMYVAATVTHGDGPRTDTGRSVVSVGELVRDEVWFIGGLCEKSWPLDRPDITAKSSAPAFGQLINR